MLSGFPSTILFYFLPDRIGRKRTLIFSELILAISCLTGTFLQYYEILAPVQMVCFMLTRLMAGLVVKVGFLLLNETFPTPIRNTAVAIGGAFSGIGAILGLLLEALEIIWSPLPVVIIASTVLIGVM